MADNDKLGSPFDPTQPDYAADPRWGDNQIADTKQRLLNWATAEHNVDGKHKIPTSATLPTSDATATGRLAIKSDTKELYADITGAAFEKLTSKSEVTALQAADTTHAASNPADHVAGSIRKKHLDGSVDTTSIASLVGGGETTLHSHAAVASTSGLKSVPFAAQGSFAPVGLGTTITKVIVEAWGGGGGGGTGGSTAGPGGGGGGCGAFARAYTDVTGLTSISIGIGAGGGAGGNGANTTVGTLLTCGGGVAGNNGGTQNGVAGGRCGTITRDVAKTALINFISYNGIAGAGGSAGSPAGGNGSGSGIIQNDGGSGGSGGSNGDGGYGGSGGRGGAGGGGSGSAIWGSSWGAGGGGGGGGYGGGAGGAANATGSAGSHYGAGGGGGGGAAGGAGGAGSAGYVIIYY